MEEGRKLLGFAAEEINRAQEDVVNYLVCHNTRSAIVHFLQCFLLKYNESANDEAVDILLGKCRKLDDRFSHVDLSAIVCSKSAIAQNDCYCLDMTKLQGCIKTAQQIERMVSSVVPAY